MRWNTPLSEDHAALLMQRLDPRPGVRVLDLGCAWGELLLRVVAAGGDGATGTGVDIDARALERGRALAEERGLEGRVTLVRRESATWDEPADRVLCVGASHAWPSVEEAMAGLTALVPPGGRLLFGEGCWERPPTEAASALFGDDVIALADLVRHAVAAGWRILHLSTADQREWDDFEATWRAGRQEWLLANPDDDRAFEVRELLDRQLHDYVNAYRGVLGFAYLVLARS